MAEKDKLVTGNEAAYAVTLEEVDQAPLVQRHCLHDLPILGRARPVIYQHVCCWCGQTRQTVGRFAKPVGEHGNKLPHDYSEEVYDTPWNDSCLGRVTNEEETENEPSDSSTGTTGDKKK
jgi:hypothetical protein